MARKRAVKKAGKKKPATKAGRKPARKAVGRKAPARRSGAAVKRKTKPRTRKPKMSREDQVLAAILKTGMMGD